MYCLCSRVLLLYITLVEVKRGQASDMSSQTIELAALGRPLFPGMLYDCRKDSFIPGVTLWDKKSLREDLDSRPQLKTDLKFSSSDSLSSKSSLLSVSASLKASFLWGLVEVGGSAKFLNDIKSSNQQSRVTMHYSETSKFEQLTMTQLGKITYPEVFEQKTATHVVTAVLYGAQAFMVFDRSFAEDENKQDIEEGLNVMIKKIPGFSIEGQGALQMTDDDNKKAESITCTFYGDIRLEQNPTTYLEALEVYKNLPKHLKENPQNAVPIKVWLYPLSLLDTKAAQLGREISMSLIYKTERMMERLRDVERTYNDLSRRTEVNVFSDVKTRLRSFQDSFSIYKIILQKAVARVLPAIRGGSIEEQSLEAILMRHSSSPFNADLLDQWLEDAKSELKLLKDYTTTLNEINIVDSNRLKSILLDPDINVVVSLTFTSLKYEDPYLSSLAEFLKSEKFTKLDEEINLPSVTSDTRKWFNDPEVIPKMRENLLIFRKFSEANKHTKSIRFIISIISNPSIPGTSIYLYENGKATDTKFQPVSKPPPPIVKNVLWDTVYLKLQNSSTGETVKYRVEYKQVKTGSGNEEDWLVTDTYDEDFILTELKRGEQYQIRYRIVGKVGVSEASETVSKKTVTEVEAVTVPSSSDAVDVRQETCTNQKKEVASKNERLNRACKCGMDYAYKAKVVKLDLTQYIYLEVESVLREGTDVEVEGRVIQFLAPLSCRERLGLVKDKSYLIMGKSNDLIMLGRSLQYVFRDGTWVEYWPTEEEAKLREHRDRYIGLSELEETLTMYGCPT